VRGELPRRERSPELTTQVCAARTLGSALSRHEEGQRQMVSIYYLLVAGATMGLLALFAFLWGVRNGAFENAEDAKYIVFRDEDDD
jgi:cbb3-type cytochrome oxidase maturation protein